MSDESLFLLNDVTYYEKQMSKIKDVTCSRISLSDFKSIEENGGKLIIPDNSNIYKKCIDKGLQEFKDFVIDKYYKKKIAVIYGNCHTTVIFQLLDKCNDFNEEYCMYPIPPIHMMKSESELDHPVFRNCDLFIHQSIRKENRYGESFASENIITKLKLGCKIIAIPNVYHLAMCYFPQYSDLQEFAYHNQTIFFRDWVLDSLYSKNYSIKDIIEKYNNYKFDTTEIEKNFVKFIEKVKVREMDWDIKVSDYIKENKAERLFFDPNHPTQILLIYITKCILNILQINYDNICFDSLKVIVLDQYEMPLCIDIKKHFGITDEKYELRKTGRKIIRGKMYCDGYIKQYLAFEWQDKTLSKYLRVRSYLLLLRYMIPECIFKKYDWFKHKFNKVIEIIKNGR